MPPLSLTRITKKKNGARVGAYGNDNDNFNETIFSLGLLAIFDARTIASAYARIRNSFIPVITRAITLINVQSGGSRDTRGVALWRARSKPHYSLRKSMRARFTAVS